MAKRYISSKKPPRPDHQAPTVQSFAPAGGGADVAINAAITVVFSEAMNAATITNSTVLLLDGATPVAAAVVYNSGPHSATLTPSASLDNSKTYTIKVLSGVSGVKDVAGNALASDATSTFTTVSGSPDVLDGVDTASALVPVYDDTGALAFNVNGPAKWTGPTYAQGLGSGTIYTPADGTALNTLLNGGTLVRGDTIKLTAGTTYTHPTAGGIFVIPQLAGEAPGAGWLYIIGSKLISDLPAEGSRIRLSDASNMPTIQSSTPVSGDYAFPGLAFALGASRVRVAGVRFTCGAASDKICLSIVACGYNGGDLTTTPTTLANLGNRIIFERCIIQGRNGTSTINKDGCGLRVMGYRFVFRDSIITGIAERGSGIESYGIWVYTGSVYQFENNEIVAAGENIFMGAGPIGSLTGPTDITIKRNYVHKIPQWIEELPEYDGSYPLCKNLTETKGSIRLEIAENIYDLSAHTYGGQDGGCLVITPRQQGGSGATSQCTDIWIHHNILRNINEIVRFANADYFYPTLPTTRFYMHDNLGYGIRPWGAIGNQAGAQGFNIHFATNNAFGGLVATNVACIHNTFVGSTTSFGTSAFETYFTTYLEGSPQMIDGAIFRDNIFEGPGSASPYSVLSSDLAAFFVTVIYTGNVHLNEHVYTLPAGNYSAVVLGSGANQLDFEDYANLDFRIKTGCAYKAGGARDATDGLDQGADIAAVLAATAGVDS